MELASWTIPEGFTLIVGEEEILGHRAAMVPVNTCGAACSIHKIRDITVSDIMLCK